MEGSVPKEVLQYTDQHERDLQRKIAIESTQAGHPSTVVDINPSCPSHLDNIKDMIGKTTHNAADSIVGGGSMTGVETVPGRNALSYAKERIGRLLGRKKAV